MSSLPNSGSPSTILILGHHDADGIVSAALIGSFLSSEHPEATLEYGIVDFHLAHEWSQFEDSLRSGEIPGWAGPDRPNGVAIVDFPAANIAEDTWLLYADHHDSSFRSLGADEKLRDYYFGRARKGAIILHDSDAPSCVDVLLRGLLELRGWRPARRLRTACRLADRIDRAAFASAAEAVDHRDHLSAAVSALCLSLSAQEAAETARSLAGGAPLRHALFERHRIRAEEIFADLDGSLRDGSEAIRPLGDHAVLMDWTHPIVRSRRPVRFAEYHLTDSSYSVRLEALFASGKWILKATLGRSPWIRPLPDGLSHPDLRKLAESVGGGGHEYAAGFRVEDEDLETARKRAIAVVTGLIPLLRPLPSNHPIAVPAQVAGCHGSASSTL